MVLFPQRICYLFIEPNDTYDNIKEEINKGCTLFRVCENEDGVGWSETVSRRWTSAGQEGWNGLKEDAALSR